MTDGVAIVSDVGTIAIFGDFTLSLDVVDYAAWYLLPIAMRTGRSLCIHGKGSQATIENARRISDTWRSWLPGHFRSIDVAFDEVWEERPRSGPAEPLCFYSGGVDSTYSVLKRVTEGKSQHLLTVHGMDYAFDNAAGFSDLLAHTDQFAHVSATGRLTVRSNAYDVYELYRLDFPGQHISHIFSLAGAGFLHASNFKHLMIAADHRLDQQFARMPYGSNSATNPLFSDGDTSIVTLDDDIGRSEKTLLLSGHEAAVQSLSVCLKRAHRPRNCGQCSKCVRTKLNFLAATGTVPGIFASGADIDGWQRLFRIDDRKDLVFLLDVVTTAERHDTANRIVGLREFADSVRRYWTAGRFALGRRWGCRAAMALERRAFRFVHGK